ncbi:hypothetical protein D9M70_459350 [compost metagenome]
MLGQVFGQAVGAMLGAGEHQDLLPGADRDQVRQQGALVAGGEVEHALLDALHRGVRRGHFDAFGIVQQLVGEVDDVFREGCREQQVLALGRELGEDLLHIVDEAHVEHPVGFVEHEDFHMGEVDVALAGQVEQAAGAGHQQVHALGQGLHLGIHADATENAGADQFQVTGVELEAVVDLGRQFAGRCQDQYARLARAMTLGFVVVPVGEQQFQDGQGETGGLAGACLGRNHQVATLQHGGNCPLLHGSGLGVAGGFDGADQCLGETEGSKGHGRSCVVLRGWPDGVSVWLESRRWHAIPTGPAGQRGGRTSGRMPDGSAEYNSSAAMYSPCGAQRLERKRPGLAPAFHRPCNLNAAD